MAHHPPVHAVDERLPLAKLILFGLQHVLVVAASPITAVFLVAKALGLSSALTVDLISATFLVCGLGTLLQSFGPLKFGARLPFIMVPGGAPVVLFVLIAQQTNLQTAAGATILTGLLYFLLLPVFARCLRFFPRIVIGTMLILVAVNLIRIYGVVIVGTPGTAEFGSPVGIGLALSTVGFTVLFAKLFKGMLGQLAVLLGLLAGAALAWSLGLMSFAEVWSGALVTLPTPLPFGMPRFDVLAALPLLIFSVISMAEATGQTIAIAEVVGKEIDPQTEVPRTIRGDATMSVLGGLFGTSLIITSSENIGIVQATGVRSRFVTAAAGVLLIVIALLAPLGRLANAIPAPVVGGTALIVFSIIGVMGINLLRQVELRSRANMYTLAAALTMGVLPIVVPGVYSRFPAALQIVLGNGLAMGALTAVLVNALFAHLNLNWRERHAADPAAHLEAAVNDNRSCH
ncbi:nucleobase:cation symporter [Caballeronia temeraria]|uniref:Nucleobase:cation symporter n=1 Tax=Caballeronia temeraria TaxID=1777137 RepID=A0A158C5G1_9BURK|nr:uracil-xanthine permease family protein [Caballeronia temeraria]SAK77542.1 nucleobase:cation symporter [Caballeronia temeraria]